jgi:cytochrome P450
MIRPDPSNGSEPPRVRTPKPLQGVAFAFFRRRVMRSWIRRYGRVFGMNIPVFGRSVVVSDPAVVRAVCTAGNEELANVRPSLSNLFGPGSLFALDGIQHRDRRRLLAPAFRGHSMRDHEKVIEAETLREIATWPENREFRTLEPMNRIALNVILWVLFGADGGDGADGADSAGLAELRVIVPPYIESGSRVAFLPTSRWGAGRWGPWARMAQFRNRFDRIVFRLIDRAESDPGLAERTDILALLVRAGISREDICDEVLTFIGAGHETTASALSWALERLRRHPGVLDDLVHEVDEGGSTLLRATILEVLRTRTVIDVAARRVEAAQVDLGGWRIPQGHTVFLRIADLHENPDVFPHAERFDPYRFAGDRAPGAGWLAFGGGSRRCVGADFAIAEMEIVLRAVLRHFRIHTDTAADEKSYFRGVAHTPKLGGLVVLSRRE